VLVGALGAVAVPVGVVFSRWVDGVTLLDAAIAIPVAVVLGLVALVLGRRSRRQVEWTLGRVGGAGAARVGSTLGVLTLALALTAALALGFYALLDLLGR
jgi:hypothetical protein